MQLTIKSHTDPNTEYLVTFPDDTNGVTQAHCTCKGYGYRRTCSHITEARAQLEKLVVNAVAMLPGMAAKLRHCLTCSTPLVGTHAMLDKCAACYRKEVFGAAV